MPINFPNSPSSGQLYTYDNKTWEFNGVYWEVYSALTSYITSAYTVGDGVSDISGVTGGNIALKSFSGVNITIIDSGDKLTFSSSTTSSSVSGDYLPLSGGTVTGSTNFTAGLTANTISATTYQNLPVSGLTGESNISVTGSNGNFTISFTGTTGSNFTGGTVTGATIFTNGLTANTFSATTISATNYQNLPTDIRTTGATYSDNTFTFTNNTGGTYSVLFNTVTGLTVNGGLTANTLSATTITATQYNNLPLDVFVTGGTYTSGSLTFRNNSGGTFTVSGLPIGGQGGQVYYFNTSVTQTPYKEFGPTGTSASEQSTTISVASGNTTTIQSYLTPVGYPNSILIPGGVWSFYLHTYKEDVNSSFDVYSDIYLRTSGGVETYLFSTDPFDVASIASTPSMGISDGYFSGKTINASDRILVLIKATNTGTSTKNITFVTEGTLHYSYGITTFTNLPANVSSLNATDGVSASSTTGAVTIINTDKGSSQNIFKNIQIDGNTNFTANSNTANLNFSGVNISIFSASSNTLVFSAGTGGSNTVQGITGITATDGLSGNTSSFATTIINIDKGSTQNIFKNIQIGGIFQFSASTNNSNLNFSGIGLTITSGANNTLVFSASPGGVTSIIANTSDGISASSSTGAVTLINTRPQGITGITATDGVSANTTSFLTTIINTDKGSSQNIFKNIQIGGITQFSAGSNNSNINFSGVNINITSAATNTLVFTNSLVQGITGITSGAGITATTTNNVTTITNLGVTGITAGYGVSANTSTGNVTIIQRFDYGKAYTTGNNLSFI